MKQKNLTAHYALIQSIFWVSGCCTLTYTTPFLQSRGFSNTQIGFTLAIASCLAIVLQPLLAAFADKTTKISLKGIISVLLGLSALIALVLTLLPEIFLPTAILSLLLSTLTRMQNSLLVSLSSEQVQAGGKLNFSLARGFGSFTYAIAALLIGRLTDKVGAGIIVPITAAGALAAIGIISFFPKPEKALKKSDEPTEAPSGLAEFVKNNSNYILVILSLVFIYLSHVFINSFTIQIVTSRGGFGTEMGLASAIGGFLELPAMALFPFLLKKVGSVSHILKMSAIAMVVKSLITLLSPSMGWFYFAQALQFFAYAMLIPAGVYYVNRMIAKKDKVKGQSFMDMSQVITSVIGSILGGIFLDAKGVDFMLTVGTVVSAIGAVMLCIIIKKDNPTE